jgi:hypothetical protein
MMLGELIANLDRPGMIIAVLSSLDSNLLEEIKRRASAESMTPDGFAAGAVREFIERGNDDLWFQLLTVIRQAEDPSSQAIQTILQWVVASDGRSS